MYNAKGTALPVVASLECEFVSLASEIFDPSPLSSKASFNPLPLKPPIEMITWRRSTKILEGRRSAWIVRILAKFARDTDSLSSEDWGTLEQ